MNTDQEQGFPVYFRCGSSVLAFAIPFGRSSGLCVFVALCPEADLHCNGPRSTNACIAQEFIL